MGNLGEEAISISLGFLEQGLQAGVKGLLFIREGPLYALKEERRKKGAGSFCSFGVRGWSLTVSLSHYCGSKVISCERGERGAEGEMMAPTGYCSY